LALLGLPAVFLGEVAEVTDISFAIGAERSPMAFTDAWFVLGGLTGPCIPIREEVITDGLQALADLDPVVVVISAG
jgi:hypothetical protein